MYRLAVSGSYTPRHARLYSTIFDYLCLYFCVRFFIHFASAVIAVDSSHMTVSSSVFFWWSSFSPPSNFVSGHVSTSGSLSVTGRNHRKVIGQDPICADLPWPVQKRLSRDHV